MAATAASPAAEATALVIRDDALRRDPVDLDERMEAVLDACAGSIRDGRVEAEKYLGRLPPGAAAPCAPG